MSWWSDRLLVSQRDSREMPESPRSYSMLFKHRYQQNHRHVQGEIPESALVATTVMLLKYRHQQNHRNAQGEMPKILYSYSTLIHVI